MTNIFPYLIEISQSQYKSNRPFEAFNTLENFLIGFGVVGEAEQRHKIDRYLLLFC